MQNNQATTKPADGTQSAPHIGQIVMHVGSQYRIFAIHPAGTIDIEQVNGPLAFRVSGLAMLRHGHVAWHCAGIAREFSSK